MPREFDLTPKRVPPVETPYRRIVTELPAPQSLPILERLYQYEPVAMRGQPPVVWDHAEGFQVYDGYGNKWIDWSSGVLISFATAFQGRTLGGRQAGGIPALKEWIGNLDPGFVQIEFPDGFRTTDTSFEFFERSLAERGIEPQHVAGVILETYQGGSAAFAPPEYMQSLRQWCTGH